MSNKMFLQVSLYIHIIVIYYSRICIYNLLFSYVYRYKSNNKRKNHPAARPARGPIRPAPPRTAPQGARARSDSDGHGRSAIRQCCDTDALLRRHARVLLDRRGLLLAYHRIIIAVDYCRIIIG